MSRLLLKSLDEQLVSAYRRLLQELDYTDSNYELVSPAAGIATPRNTFANGDEPQTPTPTGKRKRQMLQCPPSGTRSSLTPDPNRKWLLEDDSDRDDYIGGVMGKLKSVRRV
jgi:hypothetical protein